MRLQSNECLPPLLNEKIIDTFQHIGPQTLSFDHQRFELIRNNCKYYSCSRPGSFLHNNGNENLILHINARSILTNEKFEEFQTFLYMTGKHWSMICVSET